MCEHELRGEEAWAFLVNCLAAAHANNKALREENERLRHKVAGHDTTMLRNELAAANARIKSMQVCGSCVIFREGHRNDFCAIKGPHIPTKRHWRCDTGEWSDKQPEQPYLKPSRRSEW